MSPTSLTGGFVEIVHVVEHPAVLALALGTAAHVLDRTGADPWRITAADYRAAVTDTGPGGGRLTTAPWDPSLAAALAEHGTAVPEERVIAPSRER